MSRLLLALRMRPKSPQIRKPRSARFKSTAEIKIPRPPMKGNPVLCVHGVHLRDYCKECRERWWLRAKRYYP